jgi:hypothetical protein
LQHAQLRQRTDVLQPGVGDVEATHLLQGYR